jgi:hypothetical protein
MTVKVRIGGALRTATSIKVKAAGVLRTVRTIRVKHGGTLRTVYSSAAALSASASPTSVLGLSFSSVCLTDDTTVTPSGGAGPYTYAWTLITFSGGNSPTVTAASFATTAFRQTGSGGPESNTATFRCTVTDSLGATATADVDATFVFENLS